MEDEDGESKVLDMWNILEEQRLKDSTLGNTLKHSIDDVYTDVIEEEKQLMRYNSIVGKDLPGKNTIAGPKFIFKGFKKRILAETREVPTAAPKNSTPELRQSKRPNARTGKDKGVERKRKRKITEYAQYLGLQPSTRYKCSKCHTWSSCGPNSKQNLCACNPSMTPMPSTSESSASVPHASNFKITRKVYLCSACGTYFENWNMFLHMRDIHKRHICLYCLGMFGQAERLSYHLTNKHSVPEMAFSTVEDFYNAFKGSCYLICCSCEKVFSETDDFFNHFCSPPLEQDATVADASTCTICRQTGTHASTCNFTLSLNTDKELRNAATPPTVADATCTDNASPAAVPPSEITTNLGGKASPPRKAIKYNRRKLGRDVMQNSHQQKANALAEKLGTNDQCNENQIDGNLQYDAHREIANSLPRDTVTETIMEVSRYIGGNSSDENDENDEQVMNKDVYNNRDKESGGKSPVQNCQLDFNEPYDSVTETIMEVSRYRGEEDRNEREDATYSPNLRASHAIEKINIEDEEMCDKSDVDPSHSASSRAPSPAQWDAEETATADTKANAMCETETKSRSHSCDSPQDARSCSPVNRSLFSPQHETHVLDPQYKEREQDAEDVDKKVEKPVATNATESQASASFNAVVPSDRSLVIKICNRNSQFTVATTTVTSRESEENNNAEGSTSKERLPNGSEMEGDVGDDQVNEMDDSDSDSDKLAVVDSNPEEDEEAEDAEEDEEADEGEDRRDDAEAEDRCDDAEDEDQRNRQGNGETGTGTYTDEMFSVTDTMTIGNANERSDDNAIENVANEQTRSHTIDDGGIVLAGEDVPCIDLNVEGTLDSMELEELLKRCIEAASPTCVYCNHARYIAVNGRQLGLHMLAEHKFQPQHPAIIIHAEQFTARVKKSLDELESRYFNLDTYNSTDGTYNVPDVLMYECFHCRFHSTVHKELYLHNRKMHQKTILICIMCKSTFYSYSELVCHLCPGIYSPNVNLRYRCCLCSVVSLPSAFRLMVHVRKRHHACDVCLESTGNQQRLSNHVWKHKLHHLCYRCGIAYRNKPDITKHLFWKHGTESVLCRKCLQKKWPHIYHFCIPPTAFVCEECGSSFGRAVALKVHKRLHSGDLPYGCDECGQRFISRKLLAKHQAAHREPEPEDVYVNVTDVVNVIPAMDKDEKTDGDVPVTTTDGDPTTGIETASKNVKEAVKKVVDVYDLPPLNLSSESDTDSEEEKLITTEKPPEKENVEEDAVKETETTEKTATAAAAAAPAAADDDDVAALNNDIVEVERNEEEKKQEARIMDGIWDNFKTYAASLDVEESAKNVALKESVPETDAAYLRSIVFSDHDYCVVYSSDKEKNEDQATSKDNDEKAHETKSGRSPSPGTPSRNAGCDSDANKRKTKTPKKKKSGGTSSTSDSSSDTDSSSCSCGTNCSCSSSSSGSSSSSSSSSDSDSSASEGSPRKQSGSRKERNKKEREAARENKSQSVEPENKTEIVTENGPVVPEVVASEPSPANLLLRESDLETEETETDEDFYDEYPQLLANKLLAEKRNQLLLLATVAPASTPSSTPTSTPTLMEQPSMPLNNGVLVAETLPETIAMTVESQQQQQQQKRKTKTKKRRRGERSGKRNATTTPTVESIKLNIPKAFYQKNPGFAALSQTPLAVHPSSRSSTPSLLPAATCNDFHGGIAASTAIEMQQQPASSAAAAAAAAAAVVVGVPNQNVGGSSDTDAERKRVSKRKRVPKRFYGDSSDDEPQEKQSFGRWRKFEINPAMVTTVPTFAPPPPPPPPPPAPTTTVATPPNPKPVVSSRLSFGGKTVIQTYGSRPGQTEQAVNQQQSVPPEASPIAAAPASATESEDPAESSSDSSESEAEDAASQPKVSPTAPAIGASTAERPGKIYCYCRCPYDEVSEMIACDGEDCRIEWFHFECVGIMVPPKGKWYCPDCRKKHGIVQNDEYCD